MYHSSVIFIHLCYWFICGIAFAMTQYKEEDRCTQRALTSDLAYKSSPLIKLTHPILFPPRRFLQGQSKERGEPAADQVEERPVEGGVGGAVRRQAFHHHHRCEQEQSSQTGVSQQPRAYTHRVSLTNHCSCWFLPFGPATQRQQYLSSLTMDKRFFRTV